MQGVPIMGTLGIQMIPCVDGGFVWRAHNSRANSRRCARTGGGAASTPIVDAASLLVRALFRFPSPAKLPVTQAVKNPNNALDPNNSEVQLIETIINTESCKV